MDLLWKFKLNLFATGMWLSALDDPWLLTPCLADKNDVGHKPRAELVGLLCADLKSKARVWITDHLVSGGYVASDEITEVTAITQNCNQTQWKELSIKSDIAVYVDVFNRRIVGSFGR